MSDPRSDELSGRPRECSVLSGPEWFAEACRLEGENRRLREILTSLLWWLAERDELMQLARAQIERRWPETRR